ncbi:hypothetical protein BC830DRAFT_1088771 [Chytriomyces sp. MP71]|nr:hypothetical protein BC830DRAFT_1088771 [Chytriomyces sp. MP71]
MIVGLLLMLSAASYAHYVRCGTTWEDANVTCGAVCEENADCPAGLTCFDDLNTRACDGKTPGQDVVSTIATATLNSATFGSGATGQPNPTISAGTVNTALPASSISRFPETTSEIGAPSISSFSGTTSGSGSSGITSLPPSLTNGHTTATTSNAVTSTNSGTSTPSTNLGTNGLPPLPDCAKACFSSAIIFATPLSGILNSFCSNETVVANSAFSCSQATCTNPTDQNAMIQYINSIGSDCASQGLGPSNWTFGSASSSNSNDSPPGRLSGLWIGLIAMFSLLLFAIVAAVVFVCCRRQAKGPTAEQRREVYNHVHA